MKYFVVSDVHSYFNILEKTLNDNGFDISNNEHVLVLAGDAFDRGDETLELYNFLKSIPKERFIYIRGNHEDLLVAAINELYDNGYIFNNYHYSNGTVKTIEDFTQMSMREIYENKELAIKKLKELYVFVQKSDDYVEIDNYIITHGWIPVIRSGDIFDFNSEWRKAPFNEWNNARWYNGMEMAKKGLIESNKTIICGHYHTGFGHYNYRGLGRNEFDINYIYTNKGIIALDAATHYSKTINCFIFETEDVMEEKYIQQDLFIEDEDGNLEVNPEFEN